MPSCPLCGGPEHRDADRMVERCDVVVLHRSPEVSLRELYYWPYSQDPERRD